ncbi:DUF6520 family protein [Sphingobacterium multivorum]|jgi:hypothetical protein|uniref:DUF6520 family protein n=1 Tax=Sphingobacterium multivorum TaxID=28454 RepID=UPI000DF97302|nr:DUF6520 family protein [Sphingobacterium multivorum]QQT46063.1 hypothetical protein I6J00_05180 [Sphingobacterium multivorum]SUJ30669.1 Uncharacterised protein [Sphingobacterium multivorum]
MKNFKLLLVAAVVFGAGSAFTTVTTAGKYQAETVYFSGGQWRDIPANSHIDCDEATGLCTGTGTVSNPQPTSRKGAAHVVPN